MRKAMRAIVTAFATLSAIATTPAQTAAQETNAEQRVLVFDVKEEINSMAWIHTAQALAKAKEIDAAHVVLHMNTFGGEVSFADSIRRAILDAPMPVYAYIDVNAASAGALIATACDSIFMSPGSSIGAATVVSGSDGSKMPDKYQSYMRAIMRSTAEAHPYEGPDSTRTYLRDPRIAEAFVDEHVSIEGLVDSTHVLTLTAREALKHGYCEGIFKSLESVLEHIAPNATVERYEPSALDTIKGGLLSTSLRGVLILLIVGGIYFELKTPGIGFALFAAIGAAILYFAPLYIDGLAAYWEIMLFGIGVLLILAEVFIIPGFGVAGVAGIAAVVTSLTLSLIGNDGLSFEAVPDEEITTSLWVVALSLITSIGVCVWLSVKVFKARKGSALARLTLETTQETDRGYVGVEKDLLQSMVGTSGTAVTDLRPGGKVEIDGTVYDAISDGTYIEHGRAVKVSGTSSGQLVVKGA